MVLVFVRFSFFCVGLVFLLVVMLLGLLDVGVVFASGCVRYWFCLGDEGFVFFFVGLLFGFVWVKVGYEVSMLIVSVCEF